MEVHVRVKGRKHQADFEREASFVDNAHDGSDRRIRDELLSKEGEKFGLEGMDETAKVHAGSASVLHKRQKYMWDKLGRLAIGS